MPAADENIQIFYMDRDQKEYFVYQVALNLFQYLLEQQVM